MPYFTHKKLVDWLNEAGRTLGFEVESERRRKAHEKIFQIDSTWLKDKELYAFFEAETKWEMNHIIGHIICCVDFAVQKDVEPYFVLVFLENADHCKRLENTWTWLTRWIPNILKIRCLPIYLKKDSKSDGLNVSSVTRDAFCRKIAELIF